MTWHPEEMQGYWFVCYVFKELNPKVCIVGQSCPILAFLQGVPCSFIIREEMDEGIWPKVLYYH